MHDARGVRGREPAPGLDEALHDLAPRARLAQPGLECGLQNTCTCDFFATLDYAFTIPPQASWPAAIKFVSVNVRHINIDGSEGTPNGEAMGYGTTFGGLKALFLYRQFGCRPKIEVKRDYAVTNGSCSRTDIVEGKLSIDIPPPIITANGCTAPPL